MESRYFKVTITHNKTKEQLYIKVTIRKSEPIYTISIFNYDLKLGYYVLVYEISSSKIPVNIDVDIKKKVADYFEIYIDKVTVSDEMDYSQWKTRLKNSQN